MIKSIQSILLVAACVFFSPVHAVQDPDVSSATLQARDTELSKRHEEINAALSKPDTPAKERALLHRERLALMKEVAEIRRSLQLSKSMPRNPSVSYTQE
jgi:hypothetical protein